MMSNEALYIYTREARDRLKAALANHAQHVHQGIHDRVDQLEAWLWDIEHGRVTTDKRRTRIQRDAEEYVRVWC